MDSDLVVVLYIVLMYWSTDRKNKPVNNVGIGVKLGTKIWHIYFIYNNFM